MTSFDIAAVVVGLAALLGYVSYRWLRLPTTIGVLALTLAGVVVLAVLEQIAPGWHLGEYLADFTRHIDFNTLLLRGMLGLLLFAGAMHSGYEEMLASRWTIAALATIGVALSTVLVGMAGWGVFHLLGLGVPLTVCLTFGAMVSPTDPIAVLGMLKRQRAPKELTAVIAGESLFNDGMGVVIFLAFVSFAKLDGESLMSVSPPGWTRLAEMLLWQSGGGILLGLALGHLACCALRSLDHRELELLITLALAMVVYAVAFPLGVSGPFAVVVAGLLVGHHGRRTAMSPRTIAHVDAFWGMMDDIFNAVLFLLIGLEVFSTKLSTSTALAGAMMIPIVVTVRFLSVAVPVYLVKPWTSHPRGLIPILTWGGLRGALSVAMALSLPHFASKDLLVGCTYGIVVFSILFQGMTVGQVIRRFGAEPSEGG